MTGMRHLTCLWILFVTHNGCVCSDIQFLERQEGESVVLPCVVEPRTPPPYGLSLTRSWLHRSKVMYMHTESEVHVFNADDKNRTRVSGDPSRHSLNVTISDLRASDTDRYYCEFEVENPNREDLRLPGKTEFFLLVTADAPGSLGLVETCAGGSAVLPCLLLNGEGLAVEGVSLKRQRGRAAVEVLYHSKRHHGSSHPPPSSQFPVEKVHLSSAPGPGGITYNLTLQQLQPDDSGLYSCQLLLRGRPDSSTSLGRQAVLVSVQGGQCSCSSYSSLLYALSSAVAILLLFLLLAFVVIYKGKSRRSVKPHPQAPIYEEMTGLKAANRKLGPLHLEETQSSEYRNCPVKKSCPENYYESPRKDSLK
ncbi:cd7 antigen-like [Sparus aurata]|uniref:cd7 antigen-like n=1 Tax=Sparus aurata TaxID=8175 RepID=UPI0011C15780|nr:uncharacterized protein LOC115580940 [Sparus aurata]XP_030271552.1 uncharacterized protein LOC115580940 [Sparus aurata]